MIQVALSSPPRDIGHIEGLIPSKSYFFDLHTSYLSTHCSKEKEEKAVQGHIKSIQV